MPISTKNIEKSPLQIANENENIEISNSDKVDINCEYQTDEVFDIPQSEEITMKTILQVAIENGNAESVKLLLKNDKIDINIPIKITKDWPAKSPFAKNIENKTCLLIAIEN